MLHFEYRLTDREFEFSFRLNGVSWVQQWKILLLVTICLVPSLAIFFAIEAGLSMVWFGAMIVVMIVYSIGSYLKNARQPESYEQQVTFSETDVRHQFSHSMTQVKWSLLDGIEERNDSFRLKRLERTLFVPKRVLGDKVEACRALFERVKDRPVKESPPVNLYEDCFGGDSPFSVRRFCFHPDDLKQAINSHFRLANGIPKSHPPSANTPAGLRPCRVLFQLDDCVLALVNLRVADRQEPSTL